VDELVLGGVVEVDAAWAVEAGLGRGGCGLTGEGGRGRGTLRLAGGRVGVGVGEGQDGVVGSVDEEPPESSAWNWLCVDS
jgi:hypothetical protein